MGVINLLSENLINQIAAGEVVERPASVVKELIENSIDAGATEIIVDIEESGRRLIRVSDNGCGMSREDALLSLQRHATSKLKEPKDLFNISTLGFRGEALPSIASVSRLKLNTVHRDSISGTSIRIAGGKEIEVKDFGGALGTTVEVGDLFFNTPARLKFMKSPATELSHITETVTRMAVSHPLIRFLYNHNGSSIYSLPSSKDLLTRVCGMIKEEEKSFLAVFLDSNVRVRGYVSGPDISRPTQRGIYIFVNGRFVRDRIVLHAIMDAYRTIMEKDRYPLVFLFLDMPPSEVDVNVHPAKSEVRFRNTDEVHRAVYAAVAEALKKWSSQKGAGVRSHNYEVPEATSAYQYRISEAIDKYATSNSSELGGRSYTIPLKGHEFYPLRREEDQAEMGEQKGFFSSLNILGRVGGTYIVCSDGSGLYLLDQHAAHERVAFEKLKKNFSESGHASQALLIPETIELTPSAAVLLNDRIDILSQIGLEVDHFGGNTFVIKAIPAVLSKVDARGLIKDIVDELIHVERSGAFSKLVDRIISRMACHSAVEGGDRMDAMEIKALLRDLDSIDFSSNCPHGRPVFVVFNQSDIEKMFGRR